MEPEKQGTRDGACGFYSIGNALSIVSPQFPVDRVFMEVFNAHFSSGNAEHFIEGISRNRLNSLLRKTIKNLSLEVHVYRPFWSKPASSINVFRESLYDHFDNDRNCSAIIAYDFNRLGTDEEHYSHWSVIRKITDKSINMFDSSAERKFIPFSKCRIWDDYEKHKRRPYKIDTVATFLLSESKGSEQ